MSHTHNGNGVADPPGNPSPDDIRRQCHDLRAARPTGETVRDPHRPPSKGSPLADQTILDMIGNDTLLSKEIARRLGLDPDCSSLRERLSALRKMGVLHNERGEGYRLTGKTLAEARAAAAPVPAWPAIDFAGLAEQLRGLQEVILVLDEIRLMLATPLPLRKGE